MEFQFVKRLQGQLVLRLGFFHTFSDIHLDVDTVLPYIISQRIDRNFEFLVSLFRCCLLRLSSGRQRIVNDSRYTFRTVEQGFG